MKPQLKQICSVCKCQYVESKYPTKDLFLCGKCDSDHLLQRQWRLKSKNMPTPDKESIVKKIVERNWTARLNDINDFFEKKQDNNYNHYNEIRDALINLFFLHPQSLWSLCYDISGQSEPQTIEFWENISSWMGNCILDDSYPTIGYSTFMCDTRKMLNNGKERILKHRNVVLKWGNDEDRISCEDVLEVIKLYSLGFPKNDHLKSIVKYFKEEKQRKLILAKGLLKHRRQHRRRLQQCHLGNYDCEVKHLFFNKT